MENRGRKGFITCFLSLIIELSASGLIYPPGRIFGVFNWTLGIFGEIQGINAW